MAAGVGKHCGWQHALLHRGSWPDRQNPSLWPGQERVLVLLARHLSCRSLLHNAQHLPLVSRPAHEGGGIQALQTCRSVCTGIRTSLTSYMYG